MDIPDNILTAATRRFAAAGFEATSLQEIADEVGIRKPSLLYHIRTKDTLRVAVLEKLLGHWKDRLPRLLAAATSGEDQFDSVVQELISFFTADPDRARLIVREALDRPGAVRDLVSTMVRPWITITCDYIRKGQAQGRIYADLDPEAYVVQVINLVIGNVATWDATRSLLSATSEARRERNIQELFRVAKRSMFRAHCH